jgi:hypothetical protein
VILNGQSHHTGYDGEAIIAGLSNGTYPYQVKKHGYYDATGDVLINNGHDSIQVMLWALKYQTVEFFVKDNAAHPIPNATLILDNDTLTTDINGHAMRQLVSGYSYAYVLNASGFLSASGNITIGQQDTIIYITLLNDTTGIYEIDGAQTVTLYPNPVEDLLHIRFVQDHGNLKQIEVISLSGQILQSEKTSAPFFTIDLTSMNRGLYFIRIMNEHGRTMTSKVVRR